MDGSLFISSVEEAVSLSLDSQRPLVVYNGRERDDGEWLEKWLNGSDLINLLIDEAVWLKLRPGSEEFKYFEQLFPSIVVPSVYIIRQGQITAVIQGSQANLRQLAEALGVSKVNSKVNSNVNNKSFKDQVEETTQRKHFEDVQKQRRMAKEERERILQLVRADRAERKAMDLNFNNNDEVYDNIKDLSKLHAKTCVLMIRLTNSKSLKAQFNSKETLNDVRKWVDEHRTDGDCLYAFHRNIPRVTFTDSEELKSLEDLQLLPRSVLILKPLENSYTNVAEATGPGLLGKVFTGISSWLNGSNSTDDNVDNGNTDNSRNSSNSNLINRSAIQDSGFENIEERGNNTRRTSPLASPNNQDMSNMTMDSPISSRFESPTPHAMDRHGGITSNPSDVSLPSRCVTPNVYQFVNKNDDEKEKSTYNGNTINLEKKDDD